LGAPWLMEVPRRADANCRIPELAPKSESCSKKVLLETPSSKGLEGYGGA